MTYLNILGLEGSSLTKDVHFTAAHTESDGTDFAWGIFGSFVMAKNVLGFIKRPFCTGALRKSATAFICMSFLFVTSTAAPVTVDLTTFISGAGALIHGASGGTQTGWSVAAIGDHNGDGFQDYMFGSYGLDKAVIVMKRDTMYTPMTVESIVSGTFFRVINGPTRSAMGSSVGGIGDINGDNFDDVIVSAYDGQVPGRDSAGFAIVIFGKSGPFTDIIVTDSWTASSIGFLIQGTVFTRALGLTSRSAGGIGDVNGDGIADFAISDLSNNNPGVVWVIFGKSHAAFQNIDLLAENFGNNGIFYTGAANNVRFGWAISSAGDFNGDGLDDFLIGAPEADPVVDGASRINAGAVYLIHGSRTRLFTTQISTFFTGSAGIIFIGSSAGNSLGRSVAGVGDINDDGIDDIAMGANGVTPPTLVPRNQAGIVYVIYGTTVTFSSDVVMRSNFASYSDGFTVYGRASLDQIATVAPAGDLNGDGVNDILIGSTSPSSGAYIVNGIKVERTSNVDLSTDSVTSFYDAYGSGLGYAVAGGQDFNGDGIPDILLGAFFASVTPESGGSEINSAGAVWMVSGPFLVPTDAPTAAPTVNPTALDPTVNPTASPSANPSATPSERPSAKPTLIPTQSPSYAPTASPSEVPSVAPSAIPSIDPTPDPSVAPSAHPTPIPSTTPSADPSVIPSVSPSLEPSVSPSKGPTQNPSLKPTLMPTMAPTVVPTFAPTMFPTYSPTIRPTDTTAASVSLTVNVNQNLFNLNTSAYSAQQTAYNLTIQHTVADVVNGVTPERVTDIIIEEEEEEEGGRIDAWQFFSSIKTRNVGSARLKYSITVTDPLYTSEILRLELEQAAQDGRMDASLRHFASQFGATGLNNVTFGVPLVTSENSEKGGNSTSLKAWQIALIAAGGGVLVLCSIVFAGCWRKRFVYRHITVLPVVQYGSEEE